MMNGNGQNRRHSKKSLVMEEKKGRLFRKSGVWLVAAFLLVLILPAAGLCEERAAVKPKLANVRSGPGIDNDVVWQLERYHPLLVLEKKSEWVKFKDFEGDVAWIHGSLLDHTESVISIKENCNVRKGPGTNYPIVFTVERGVPFKVLSKKEKWIEIEHVDGDKGWIYSSLVW